VFLVKVFILVLQSFCFLGLIFVFVFKVHFKKTPQRGAFSHN
jgi:hypothetical protein